MPRDAAAVLLIRHDTDPLRPEVFWVKRSEKLAFLGGFHAFPGGQLDPSDLETPVENLAHAVGTPLDLDDSNRAAMISCAARELFEETGVLIAQGAQRLTVGQRASLLDDLVSGRMSFAGLLGHYGLRLDGRDWTFAGRWVTPPFSPRRFDTWFFLAKCPSKQEPRIEEDGEHESGEWIAAAKALAKWERSEILAAPPLLHGLRTLSGGLTDDLAERFLSNPHAHGDPVRRIEFCPGFICFPVRTPTLPPATHTNCYIVGSRELVVFDPGSPFEDEQQVLAGCIDDLVAEGREVREIILTHAHPDHVGGVKALRDRFRGLCVAAHRLTAESLTGQIAIDRLVEDGDVINLKGKLKGEPPMALRAMHTPGHARGHLCFYEGRAGALIAGDNVIGLGSVLIARPEGDMTHYMSSLRRMRELPNLKVLFGGHGPAMGNPYARIDEYIAHRLDRERSILSVIQKGAASSREIVLSVYKDVSPAAQDMAELAVIAHLEKLEADGLVKRADDDSYTALIQN